MTDYEKKIYERIEGAIDRTAANYRERKDHDGDLIADAFDALSNEIALTRMGIGGEQP